MTHEKLKNPGVAVKNVKYGFPAMSIDQVIRDMGRETATAGEMLGHEAFMTALRDKCQQLSVLPLWLNKDEGGRPTRVTRGKYTTLIEEPNDSQGIAEFLSFLITAYSVSGAAYAQINLNSKNRIVGIEPLLAQSSVMATQNRRGQWVYSYTDNDGNSQNFVNPKKLFRILGPTVDGINPIRPLHQYKDLIKTATGEVKNYRVQTEKGTFAHMALVTDSAFKSQDALNRVRDSVNDAMEDPDKIPIFEQSLQPIKLFLSPKEMELLSSRKFTNQQACMALDVMPHRIGLEFRTSDDIHLLDEAQLKRWNPLLVLIEREFSRILDKGYSVRFNRRAFYQGSPFRQVEAIEREFKAGFSNMAECRDDLGRPYVQGTDDLFVISNNNQTVGTLDQVFEANAGKLEERTDDGTDEQNSNDE